MRTVTFLVFDGVNALDVAGPGEAFACVKSSKGERSYSVRCCSVGERIVRTEFGLKLAADATLNSIDGERGDLLIVPGGEGVRAPARMERIAEWLKRNHRNYRRIAAVCTGAYALAAAGLLDGRNATTHWRFTRAFAHAFAKVKVQPNALFVRDGKFCTSGGIAAGIDLALALIEEDHGPRVAAETSRELVVFLRRTGGQEQFSEPLKLQIGASDRLSDVCAWAAANLDRDLSVEALAARTHLSTRQFSRLFSAAFDMSPARYVARLRLDGARSALAQPKATIAQIASLCGFAGADVFRRAFERHFGINPSEYQQRFSAPEKRR